jgi:general secretion pathway protein F
MAAFRYLVADATGKESSGVLEADSARAARQLLRGRDLIPLSVEPVRWPAVGACRRPSWR